MGGIASVKHGLNIISGVRLDGGLSWLGTFDFSDDVMLDQILLGGLGPEGGEACVIVEECLFVGVITECQEGTHLVGGDRGNG